MASTTQHQALRAALRFRPRGALRAIALITATLAAATVVGALGAGGTYAYLNAATGSQTGASLTAGTAALSISAGAQNLTSVAPGQTRTALFTITNLGDVPMNLAIGSITGPSAANGLSATVGNSSCSGTQYTTGSFGSSTLAKGASTTVCVTVKMALSAPNSAQWASTAISVLIVGTQA